MIGATPGTYQMYPYVMAYAIRNIATRYGLKRYSTCILGSWNSDWTVVSRRLGWSQSLDITTLILDVFFWFFLGSPSSLKERPRKRGKVWDMGAHVKTIFLVDSTSQWPHDGLCSVHFFIFPSMSYLWWTVFFGYQHINSCFLKNWAMKQVWKRSSVRRCYIFNHSLSSCCSFDRLHRIYSSYIYDRSIIHTYNYIYIHISIPIISSDLHSA